MHFITDKVIIVEGKYDKIKLSEIVKTPMILETNGFSLFKNKELQNLIKKMAVNPGIIIFTDSDDAGKKIRNFIKNITHTMPNSNVTDVFLPQKAGKERRKIAPSKSGLIGVEGYSKDEIMRSLNNAHMNVLPQTIGTSKFISRQNMYEYGLTGGTGSSEKRKLLLEQLDLPKNLSTSQMIDTINAQNLQERFIQIVKTL